ncbi:MAG: ferrous iron transport protein B [Desulfosalsimonadaceae bacterium]
MSPANPKLVAVAGQPNSGKSTVFNMLCGARQFVANYPGVTVEKKSGGFRVQGEKIELVDLPGTYSLSSYSLEERVARDFLLHEKPSAVLGILDAANLKQNLYFALQLLEMGPPAVLAINKMDVAAKRGLEIDTAALEKRLGAKAVPAVARKGRGKKKIQEAVCRMSRPDYAWQPLRIDYAELEPYLEKIVSSLAGIAGLDYPVRWLAVKLMEGDSQAREFLGRQAPNREFLLEEVERQRKEFEEKQQLPAERFIGAVRHQTARSIYQECVQAVSAAKETLTDRVDRIVCNRYLGPLILVAVVFFIYELAIGQGYNLTNYFLPLLNWIRGGVEGLLPEKGFVFDPVIRSFVLWFVDSIKAVFNYIPIFIILFSLIAVLENSGYLARMAFLLDKILRRFGLHGQSVLPLVLGGVVCGGCAIPGIMACRAVPDERSRLATILVVPLMNCMSKIPLYLLLIGAYFSFARGPAMFFISTVTLLMALPVARLLSGTVLKNRESAPFIMEMPAYHIPSFSAVARSTADRIWIFLKKIITVVAAVAVVLFILLRFPSLEENAAKRYEQKAEQAVAEFLHTAETTPYQGKLQSKDKVLELIRFQEKYSRAANKVSSREALEAVNKRFAEMNPAFFRIVKRGRKEPPARTVVMALKQLEKSRMRLRRDLHAQRINTSVMGRLGTWLEPVTRWAGFNQRINIALISSFAAKENAVAVIGGIYQAEGQGSGDAAQEFREQQAGFTPLHALAFMIFFALYPPCIPALLMIKVQTGSWRWMLFAAVYPVMLGLLLSSLIFSGGSALGLTGFQAMWLFYGLAASLVAGIAFVRLPAALFWRKKAQAAGEQ